MPPRRTRSDSDSSSDSDVFRPAPKKKKSSDPSKDIFPWARLHPELRNRIYEFALVDPRGLSIGLEVGKDHRRVPICLGSGRLEFGTISYFAGTWGRKLGNGSLAAARKSVARRSTISPALLLLNDKFGKEASTVLYGQKFHIYDTSVLYTFVDFLRPETRHKLLHLVVYNWGHGVNKSMNHIGLSALVECINLKSVLINCTTHQRGALLARQFFRDGFKWLDALATSKAGESDTDSKTWVPAAEVVQALLSLNESNHGRLTGKENALLTPDQLKAQDLTVRQSKKHFYRELNKLANEKR